MPNKEGVISWHDLRESDPHDIFEEATMEEVQAILEKRIQKVQKSEVPLTHGLFFIESGINSCHIKEDVNGATDKKIPGKRLMHIGLKVMREFGLNPKHYFMQEKEQEDPSSEQSTRTIFPSDMDPTLHFQQYAVYNRDNKPSRVVWTVRKLPQVQQPEEQTQV